jgi:alkaline phosphatase
MFRLTVLLVALMVIIGCDDIPYEQVPESSSPIDFYGQNNTWYNNAAKQIIAKNRMIERLQTRSGEAKNIILFVGDGMNLTTVTASRILEGQQKGQLGEENSLSFESFPFSGMAKTYSVDTQVPDSASTMTALITGVKTNSGIVGLAESARRGDCASQLGSQLVSALDLAEIAGLSTGIVTTTRVTHATPAATYAKSVERDWEDPSEMPQKAIDQGCEDIASQLINYEANLEARYQAVDSNGIEVVMGGGRRHFLPKTTDNDAIYKGRRTDGRDLIAEWKATYADGLYIDNRTDFETAINNNTQRVMGLFSQSHLRFEADRVRKQASQPSLSAMTGKAIDILDNNPKGFFLMVEAGRIDHAHHVGNAYNALSDTIEFAKAVDTAVKKTSDRDTLIIVTADHGHVFTMAGYPKRGNPILGKVIAVGEDQPKLAADNLPYTTLGYVNGRGYRYLEDQTDADEGYHKSIRAGRKDLTGVDTNQPGFYQEALIPKKTETHSGEDVPIYASGPGAYLISGSNEQTIIFHAINHAAGLLGKAEAALK